MKSWLSSSPDKMAVPVQIKVPAWVTEHHFKEAARILSTALKDLRKGGEEAFRGYIYMANNDGFPVKAGFANGQKLEEIAIRAFWWKFEQIMNEDRPVIH